MENDPNSLIESHFWAASWQAVYCRASSELQTLAGYCSLTAFTTSGMTTADCSSAVLSRLAWLLPQRTSHAAADTPAGEASSAEPAAEC